jgi:ACT domain-containing protein
MKAVVTVVGQDRVGIIAKVSNTLAENKVNILDLSQTILDYYFTMIMIVDIGNSEKSIKELSELLDKDGSDIGVSIKIQHEDIFKTMHSVND